MKSVQNYEFGVKTLESAFYFIIVNRKWLKKANRKSLHMRPIFTLSFVLLVFSIHGQNYFSGSIQSGGLTRDYRVYIPASYNGTKAVPLLFNLHGYGSNNLEQDFYGNFKPIADTANFLIVLPNGTFDNQNKRYWNNFLLASSVDDVLFISNLLDTLQNKYNIDPNRVYSTGMSNGGFMSYFLACDLNNRIAAIASVAGDMILPKLNACQPGRAVPVMQIHGTADNTVPYDGLPASAFAPIETLVNKWVALNNCNTTPQTTPVPNVSTTDGCTATRYLYDMGKSGSSVEFYKIDGGAHTWPGSAISIGVTNQDFSASWVIWKFLSKYRLNQFATATQDAEVLPNWRLQPNPAGQSCTLSGSELIRLCAYDVAGRLQYTWQGAATNTLDLPVSEWQPGIYRLVVEDAQGNRQVLSLVR